MKVFVAQENDKFDYSAAEQFGDLVFLTQHEYRSYSSPANGKIRDEIFDGLSEITPEDYLLLTGNPITMSYAFHIAACYLHDQGCSSVKILRWNSATLGYTIVDFPLHYHD